MKRIAAWRNRFMNIFRDKNNKQLALLSMSFIASFLWAVLGVAIYLWTRFAKPQYRDYGTMALSGTVVNLVLYLAQILIKASAIV